MPKPRPIRSLCAKKLRTAIAARDEAQSARDKIAASVARADEMHGKIEEELAALNDLDGKIASARATALKDALAKGAEPSILAMPKELKSLSAKRDDALNREAAVTQAREALQVELQEADAALADAAKAVQESALAVLAEQAEVIARETLAIEQRAAAHRKRIAAWRSLRRAWLGMKSHMANDWLPLDNSLRMALTASPANAGITNDLAGVTIWREAFAALLEDADAVLEALRP